MKSEIHSTVVISPEAAVFLVVVLLAVVFPNPFDEVGSRLLSDKEAYQYLTGIPVALFIWAVRTSKDLLFPSKANKHFVAWPDYWRLKVRVYIGLIILIVSSAIPIGSILFLRGLLSPRVIGSAFIASVVVGFTTAVTFYLAANNVRQITEEFCQSGGGNFEELE